MQGVKPILCLKKQAKLLAQQALFWAGPQGGDELDGSVQLFAIGL